MHQGAAAPESSELGDSELAALIVKLSQLATAIESALAGQLKGGRHLVNTLADQLAEGQVETLSTLQTAAVALRRRSDQVLLATERLTTSATVAAQSVQRAIAEELVGSVQEAAALLVAEARAVGEVLAADLARQLGEDAAAARLGIREQVDLGAEQLRVGVQETLADLGQGAERLELSLTQGLEAIGAALVEAERTMLASAQSHEERVGDAHGALTAAADSAVAAVDAASAVWPVAAQGACDDVLAAGAAVAAQIEEVGGAVLARLTEMRDEVIAAAEQTVDDVQGVTAVLLDGLSASWTEQEKRDALVDRRMQERVTRLVERTDAAMAGLSGLFSAEVARLAARDEALERQRVEEFVRVLDEVLSRPGVRQKGLRERVRRAVETSAPAAVVQPAPVLPPAPVSRPAQRSVDRVAAPVPRSAPAAKPSPKRAPRAPRKKPPAPTKDAT